METEKPKTATQICQKQVLISSLMSMRKTRIRKYANHLGDTPLYFKQKYIYTNLCRVGESASPAARGIDLHSLWEPASFKGSTILSYSLQTIMGVMQNLTVLAMHNKVNLVWVPAHRDIAGNEITTQLAKEGSQIRFTEPEPDLVITKSAVCCAINE